MKNQLDQKALALSFGIIWSTGILAVSLIALSSNGYLHNIVEFLMSIYLGYSLDFFGIIIGMIWGFFDAAIGGLVFAWLSNKLRK